MKKENIGPNKLTSDQKKSMRTRIISALIGSAIVVPSLFFGGYYFGAVVAIVAIIAGYEIVHCAKKKYNPALYIVTILLVFALAFWPIFISAMKGKGDLSNWELYSNFDTLHISLLIIIVGFTLLFFLVMIDKNFEVRDAAYIFTFGVVVGIALQCALFLRFFPQYEYYSVTVAPSWLEDYWISPLLILYVVLGTCMCDIGAYFFGMFFGHQKINPRISPKKTWAGAIGGTLTSAVVLFVFSYVLAINGYPLFKAFTADRWYWMLVLAIIIPLVAQLGDFTFSSVKRYYEIKDFGFLLPGHGGILDRIDSLVFSFIFVAIFVIIITESAKPNPEWWRVFI